MKRCQGCSIALLTRCHDFCRDEREGFIELAGERAAALGHTLGPFEHVQGQALWIAMCTRCHLAAVVRLDPDAGEAMVNGGALDVPCEGSSGP